MIEKTRALFAERVLLAGGRKFVAEKLDCTPTYIDMLSRGSGERQPSLEMAAKIEDLLGIPVRAWADDDDVAAVK